MKIFDCTTFFDEKMMMDVRFNILDKHVSNFIVVESLFSHSGSKKKLNFNINDYPKFKDKIRYIVIEKEPPDLFSENQINQNPIYKRLNSIKRIEQSYNHMSKEIGNADDDDLIMISDNDEIPNLNSINIKDIKENFIYLINYFFIINLTCYTIKLYGQEQKHVKKNI